MRAALTLFLLVATATAFAEPVAKPNAPRACKPSGRVLFEVAQRAAPKRNLVTATSRLYLNGAWRTQVIDVDGKVTRTMSGCLERVELDGIRNSLNGTTWKVMPAEQSCRTHSPRFTVYRSYGKTLYTERMCSSTVLDENSQHVLDEIRIKRPAWGRRLSSL